LHQYQPSPRKTNFKPNPHVVEFAIIW
jgi:hypothetical protein